MWRTTTAIPYRLSCEVSKGADLYPLGWGQTFVISLPQTSTPESLFSLLLRPPVEGRMFSMGSMGLLILEPQELALKRLVWLHPHTREASLLVWDQGPVASSIPSPWRSHDRPPIPSAIAKSWTWISQSHHACPPMPSLWNGVGRPPTSAIVRAPHEQTSNHWKGTENNRRLFSNLEFLLAISFLAFGIVIVAIMIRLRVRFIQLHLGCFPRQSK